MDESGARVGCPTGEHIIVPAEVKEMYTASPENRKSLTIIETIIASGEEPLPPFIITPGQNIMQNWISEKLVGNEQIDCSPTGYTNNRIAMAYCNHLIKHSSAGPDKPWKLLLLDGHASHYFQPFQLRLLQNHIKPFYFPSHLTHILQALDVGIFRPWKHYHSLAINAALRSLDFEYTISSFFRDLTSIRAQTMQKHTIVNAFADSGTWPISEKAAIKKMRAYGKRKRTLEEANEEASDELDLPALPPNRPSDLWCTAAKVRALGDRDPTLFSDPSVELFKATMKDVDIELQKSHLTTITHSALQQKIRGDQKRKLLSRKKMSTGADGASITELRRDINLREFNKKNEALRKAERKLAIAINKAKKTLKTRGIQARKDEKERLLRLYYYRQQNLEIPIEDSIPIREPDKAPTFVESLQCTPEFYPELVLAIEQLRGEFTATSSAISFTTRAEGLEDSSVLIQTQLGEEEISIPEEKESSPIPEDESSDANSVISDGGSIDSIQRNADFIEF